MILRELEDLKGLIIGGANITNHRYADDTVLVADSQDDLQMLLDRVVDESRKRGLTINCKKTECLVVSKRESPKCSLKIGDVIIKQVAKFNYLGSTITENGKCDDEIKRII